MVRSRSMIGSMLLIAAAGLLVVPAPGRAQDSQYWTQKYGTRGLLLNGVVLGSAVDLSTTFYNPAGLALLPDSLSVIAVKAFDFSKVTVENATQTGADIAEPRNSILPTFFGGTVSKHLFGSAPLSYSIFPRQLATFNLAVRTVRPIDVLPQAAGPESVFIERRFEENLDETWGGVTWSRLIGHRVSIGLSQYVAVRSQRTRRQVVGQAFANDSTAGSVTDLRGFSYNDIRAVTKIGFAFELKKIRAGLSLTSPGLHISGSADVGLDRFRSGLDVDGDGRLDNELIVSLQEGVSSNFKSPPSIGAGVAFDVGRTTVHLSAEAFDGEDRYSVFETAPAADKGTGQQVPFKFYDERESVLNFGGGLEHRLGAVSAAFLSFSTDYSSVPHGNSDLALGDWDSNLITGGVTIPVLRSEFTLGVGYGFGSGDAERLKRSADAAALGSALDIDFDSAKTSYRNLRVIFGFTI